MRDWKIRTATEQDIAAVLRLWQSAGAPATVSDTPAGLGRLLARDPQALLLAEADGGLVGSLIATWDGWRGGFYRLVVVTARRREGIATALAREGERRMRERGAVRLAAIVREDEPVATAFWEAAGYARQPLHARFVRHLDG